MKITNVLRLLLLASLLGAGCPALAETTEDEVYAQTIKDAIDVWWAELSYLMSRKDLSELPRNEIQARVEAITEGLVGRLRQLECRNDQPRDEIEHSIGSKLSTLQMVAPEIKYQVSVRCIVHLDPTVAILVGPIRRQE
jgi:hypothetical protein